jgi:chemotaxis response regulator CheB
VVFGMPKEAIKLNAVDKIMPLDQIAPFVQKYDTTKDPDINKNITTGQHNKKDKTE